MKIELPKPSNPANNSKQMKNISDHHCRSVVETPNANKTRHRTSRCGWTLAHKMKELSRIPRWAMLLATGFSLVVLLKVTLNHPFFWLCVDTKTTVWEYERTQNSEILLSAIRSPILPHSVRVKSLRGLLKIKDSHGERIFLPNEEVDKLKETFSNDFDSDFFTLFFHPFIGDEINPRVINLILDPHQKRDVRLVAFLNLAETSDLTSTQALQIKNLWVKIEPVELQSIIRNFIDSLSEHDNLDSELVMLFLEESPIK